MAVAEAILLLRGQLLLGGSPQRPGLSVPQLLPQRPPLEEAQPALVIPAMEATLEAEIRGCGDTDTVSELESISLLVSVSMSGANWLCLRKNLSTLQRLLQHIFSAPIDIYTDI